ncbi:hypothetical protein PG997_005501 [Apiospora hydei]|uniref:Uncharacterized protein n=1 Tax=Apiospora hydei TaxID=1337664 RepID=A0ABR1WP21_9PEZI
MGNIYVRNTWTFCLILFLVPLCLGHDQTDTSACNFTIDWVDWIFQGNFEATQDCGDFNLILQEFVNDFKHDYCLVTRQYVLGYIREGLRFNLEAKKDAKMPEDCEIERWWYEGYYDYERSRVAFCKNATATHTTALSYTQPFFNLIHGPRTFCHNKLKEELATIGNPDIAGWGVMTSFPEVYEYRLLTMAPAFTVLPVLVAHTLYEGVGGAGLSPLYNGNMGNLVRWRSRPTVPCYRRLWKPS